MRNIRARLSEPTRTCAQQHTVSQVVQRRFTRPAKGNKWQLMKVDLRRDRAHATWSSPKNCAVITDFVPYASESLEAYWSAIETGFHVAFTALDDGTLFTGLQHLSVVRDMVALHYVRSPMIKGVHDETLHQALTARRADLRARPEEARRSYLASTGIHTVGGQAVDYIIDRDMRETKGLAVIGAMARERLVDMYHRVRDVFDAFTVEILTAQTGEFLLADAPVININPGNDARATPPVWGLLQDDEFLLPLGPSHTVRLHRGARFGYTDVPGSKVDTLNTLQVLAARDHVIARPGSGLVPFIQHVQATRVRTQSGADWPE